ncbi:MAG: RHS repeat-associated core domain-containing protein [Phycisphaerales bacterium]
MHDYTYDNAGRVTADKATTLGTNIEIATGSGSTGSNIDGGVRRIETAYDTRGMVSTVTQYDATSSGTVLDQVKNTYDEWGNLQVFQQDYNGTVAGSSGDDLGVEYTNSKVNDTSSVSGKRRSGIRVTGVKLERSAGATTKQDIRRTFSNSSSYDDDIGRVTTLTDSGGSTTYAEYLYGGVGMAVQTKLSEPGITYELATSGTSGYNTFLDQFGRVIKSRWRKVSNGAIWFDSDPVYDDNSNITKVQNNWVTLWSQSFGVDAINRLDEDRIGTMASGSIADAATIHYESWRDYGGTNDVRLSQTGNWSVYKEIYGDPTLGGYNRDETRKSLWRNEPKETTDAVLGTTLRYLAAKNGLTTRDDTTTFSLTGYRYIYDAWNRLVKVTTQISSSSVVAEYRYNGLGHRIGWKARFDIGQTYANNKWRYFQYNEKWQQVGMYLGTTAANGAVSSDPIELYLYDSAGLDGRGGSSYIDRTIYRDRDVNGLASGGDGTLEERRYYLQNWRNDVVELVKSTGEIVERYRYDAYGRPYCFSSGDLSSVNGYPDGVITTDDTAAFNAAYSGGGGAVGWQSDIGNTAGAGIPDGQLDSGDSSAFTAYYGSGYIGGFSRQSATAIDNRKGFAGYEFDPILAGSNGGGGTIPFYHVRNRVLNCDSGKWLQKDPLGYHDSMDLYEYCQSDPVDNTDWNGECITSVDCAVLGCLRLPTAAQRIQCLEALVGLSAELDAIIARMLAGMRQAVKKAVQTVARFGNASSWCATQYVAYKGICGACSGLGSCNTTTPCVQACAASACWAACYAARLAYHANRSCPGSRIGHQTEVDNTGRAATSCSGRCLSPACLSQLRGGVEAVGNDGSFDEGHPNE